MLSAFPSVPVTRNLSGGASPIPSRVSTVFLPSACSSGSSSRVASLVASSTTSDYIRSIWPNCVPLTPDVDSTLDEGESKGSIDSSLLAAMEQLSANTDDSDAVRYVTVPLSPSCSDLPAAAESDSFADLLAGRFVAEVCARRVAKMPGLPFPVSRRKRQATRSGSSEVPLARVGSILEQCFRWFSPVNSS